MPRNPAWQRDELILSLDLYFHFGGAPPSASHPKVIELSEILNRLPIHLERPEPETFRNPNGVSMKLSNFLRFDPTYDGEGLSAGGRLEEQIWNEYHDKRAELRAIANRIKSVVNDNPMRISLTSVNVDLDEQATEGEVLLKLHKYRERNKRLVKKKKESILVREGRLQCEICEFDFNEIYGDLGSGYIECHHNKPIHQLEPNETTTLNDLSLVCANCHRMLHRQKEGIKIQELKELISVHT
jgi:5-methylcytosine-specific restriction protein A